LLSLESAAAEIPTEASYCDLLRELSHFFAVEFSVWTGSTGDLLHASTTQPVGDQLALAGLVSAVEQRQEACFILDGDSVLSLAIPVVSGTDSNVVVTAWFVTREVDAGDTLADAPALLLMTSRDTLEWAREQEVWSPKALLRLAEAVSGKQRAEASAKRNAHDVQVISGNLASTYEEISLVHAVTQNLRISSTEGEIGQMATEWLGECVPAKAFAVQYLPVVEDGQNSSRGSKTPEFYTAGDCPIDNQAFSRLIEHAGLKHGSKPYIANEIVTAGDGWPFPRIRQAIIVPLSEGNKVFGWLAAFNHQDYLEFGTVEAQLLNSLGALLGIHSSNRLLYREQADFVANVVRALVSAIDAKDPYTSGHSDRVSRVAVRIALELRCNPKIVNTIYMAGLLHDVGKIGINDSVLRKAGRLTDQEFEHIKLHPEMGYRILADLRQLADVLPAVLHHHEQWDGGGYPHGLKGEETPLIARIMAVADAYDAMTSDRPYRKGMCEEKVQQIFRDGAGKQWDAKVVEAFFAANEDIVAIATRERVQLVEHWV
jgi:HD-GYP domain-containing protein (c-di-GMP phosphodiesterase class II)